MWGRRPGKIPPLLLRLSLLDQLLNEKLSSEAYPIVSSLFSSSTQSSPVPSYPSAFFSLPLVKPGPDAYFNTSPRKWGRRSMCV